MLNPGISAHIVALEPGGTAVIRRLAKHVLLLVGAIGVSLVIGEASAYLAYRIVWGRTLPIETYRRALHERAMQDPSLPAGKSAANPGEYDETGYPEVIHPYLGFVPEPAGGVAATTVADRSQILPRSDDALTVGVFGGSFARDLCHLADAELLRALRLPADKKARVVCVAAGGYKQPQQLLALSYLLGLGGHFDIVINIDGFNEVALPPVENVPEGVAADYPRGWSWRVAGLRDPQALEMLGGLYALDASRRRWATTLLGCGAERSALGLLLWLSRDRFLEARRSELVAELDRHEVAPGSSYAVTGPKLAFASEAALFDHLANLWRDSSLQMKRLCDANGIAYHHFLQPNQYVADSKPMGADERRIAIRPGHPYGHGVVAGYPLLRGRGNELVQSGVSFHDLTGVFAGVSEPLYKDDCCHVSSKGYAVVADAIGSMISAGSASRD